LTKDPQSRQLVLSWGEGPPVVAKGPQFKTEIDGVDIHFIHVKSRHKNAIPLIMTHAKIRTSEPTAAHRPEALRERLGRLAG
jgi:Epoxide hydrolase N terminus